MLKTFVAPYLPTQLTAPESPTTISQQNTTTLIACVQPSSPLRQNREERRLCRKVSLLDFS